MAGKEPAKQKRLSDRLKVLGRKEVGAGMTFGASIVVFALGGYWLDGRVGTAPVLLLVGLALGAVGGFIHLVETVSPGTLFKSRRGRDKE